jgi:hypothetical protein
VCYYASSEVHAGIQKLMWYTQPLFYAPVAFLKKVDINKKVVNKNGIPIRNKGLA